MYVQNEHIFMMVLSLTGYRKDQLLAPPQNRYCFSIAKIVLYTSSLRYSLLFTLIMEFVTIKKNILSTVSLELFSSSPLAISRRSLVSLRTDEDESKFSRIEIGPIDYL